MRNLNDGKWKEFQTLLVARGFTAAELELFDAACEEYMRDVDPSPGLACAEAQWHARMLAEFAYAETRRPPYGGDWDEAQLQAKTMLKDACDEVAQAQWESAQEQIYNRS